MRIVTALILALALWGPAPAQSARFGPSGDEPLFAKAEAEVEELKPETVIIRGKDGKVTDVKKKPRKKKRDKGKDGKKK